MSKRNFHFETEGVWPVIGKVDHVLNFTIYPKKLRVEAIISSPQKLPT